MRERRNYSLGSRQKGKVAELHVISKLVASRLDVYTPILDIGVDCVIRVQKPCKPIEYYELQIKGARYKNVSIRGARKIIEYVEKEKPINYYLVVPLRKNEEYKEIIYLDKKDIMNNKGPILKNGEQDINISAQKRDELMEKQSLDELLKVINHE